MTNEQKGIGLKIPARRDRTPRPVGRRHPKQIRDFSPDGRSTFPASCQGRILIVTALVLAVAGVSAVAAWAQDRPASAVRDEIREARSDLQRQRVRDCREERTHWRWRFVSSIPASRVDRNLAYVRGRVRAVRDARPICHEALWQCVHRHEGGWRDPGGPYYGGLQMGLGFHQAYGDRQSFGRHIYREEGTANRWSEREQIAVAEQAYRENGQSSGWLNGQWPNTREECGY